MARNELPRLSRKEFIVMSMLVAARGEMYGLEIVEKSDGAVQRGTVYVILSRLEEKGYVSSRKEDLMPGAAPKRLYKPTGHGVKVFRAIESLGGRAWLREALA